MRGQCGRGKKVQGKRICAGLEWRSQKWGKKRLGRDIKIKGLLLDMFIFERSYEVSI